MEQIFAQLKAADRIAVWGRVSVKVYEVIGLAENCMYKERKILHLQNE